MMAKHLAKRHNVYNLVHHMFDYRPEDESPPSAVHSNANTVSSRSLPDSNAADLLDDEDDSNTSDSSKAAAGSYVAEHDRYDALQLSPGHRKRKREDLTEQEHSAYGDKLLDYFRLRKNGEAAIPPDSSDQLPARLAYRRRAAYRPTLGICHGRSRRD